ncbi:MAG: hypothetical protein WCJ14_07880 [Verrucomicrobiota bacterium]
MKPHLWLLLPLLAAGASADLTQPNKTAFEAPPVLSATQLLGPDAAGPCYRVREPVPTDGYMAHFSIDSDFGRFECIGLPQTRTRIREMAALQKLVTVSKSDLFADGVKRSIEQPIAAVKNIAKDPVGAAKAAPKTVGHFFQKIGKSIGDAASNVQDRINKGDDSDMGADASRAAKGVIGFESEKLECAKQLGVDPYSDNARLQQEIENVSWVFYAGSLPLRVGAAVASGGASMALTATKMVGLPEEIYALTPAELTLRNQQTLKAMGVAAAVAKKFAANPALSLTQRCSILRSLQALGNLKGRATVIGVAADCDTRRQVGFLDQALVLLARHPQAAARFTSLEVLGRLPAAVDAHGLLVIPAPVDYLSWTAEVAEFAHRDDLLGRKPALILTGEASARARAELARLGWSVVSQ